MIITMSNTTNMSLWKPKIKSKPLLLTRRDFLKIAALGAGTLAFRPFSTVILSDFPQADKLGRITVGKVDVFSRADINSSIVGVFYEDNVVEWIRETVGSMPGRVNQHFVETPDGFIWGGQVQPVRKQSTQYSCYKPSDTNLGQGMWVEVAVPYVDLILDNPPARAPWLHPRKPGLILMFNSSCVQRFRTRI